MFLSLSLKINERNLKKKEEEEKRLCFMSFLISIDRDSRFIHYFIQLVPIHYYHYLYWGSDRPSLDKPDSPYTACLLWTSVMSLLLHAF